MGWIRSSLNEVRRLRSRFEQTELIALPQRDGSVKRFPQSALAQAFLRNHACLESAARGEEKPEPTEFQLALMNAARREDWHDSFFDLVDVEGPIPDLSE